jgi:Na+-transporting NADH:ubiquinone oxidoreductase subunit C
MIKNKLIKERVFTVFFMVAVTFVAITLVGLVEIVTADAVQRNRGLFLRQAVSDAFGISSHDSVQALLDWFDQNVTMVENDEGQADHFWIHNEDGSKSLVLMYRGAGLWGGITAFVGFEQDGKTIRGVNFQDHVETPGLGARIDERWFRKQFVGKSGPFSKLLSEPPDKAILTDENSSFHQVTGATITSSSVREIMNQSLKRAEGLISQR